MTTDPENPAKNASNCEVCHLTPSRYRCPRCSLRTCSAACVTRHKRDRGCSGVRDRARYVPLGAFTELDLLSDYRLLEEAGRQVELAAREGALDDPARVKRQQLPR